MEQNVEVFKALSDINRLKIIDILSCGELCACDLIEGLGLTQPTISHHMKILKQADLINSTKKGKWTIYSLNKKRFEELSTFINHISSDKEDCICKKICKNKCEC